MKKILVIAMMCLIISVSFGQTKKELVALKKAEIKALQDSILAKQKQLSVLKKNLDFTDISPDTLTNKKAVITRAKNGNKTYWYLSKNGNSYVIDKMTIVLKMDSVNYYFNLINDSLYCQSQIDNTVLFKIP